MLLFIPICTLLLNTFIPLTIGIILAALSRSPSQASHYLPVLAGLAIGAVISNYIGFKSFLKLQPTVMAELETNALRVLLNRSVGFHNNHIAGKLINDASQYPFAFQTLTNAFVTQIVPFALNIIVGLVIIAIEAPLLAGLMLSMTVAVLATAFYQTKAGDKDRLECHSAPQAMISHLSDTVANSTTVTIFATASDELAEFKRRNQRLMQFRIRDWTRITIQGSRRIAVLLLFEVAFITLLIHQVAQDPGKLGIGIFTFSYALALGNRLFDIGNLLRTVEDSFLDASDMTKIIHEMPEIQDTVDAKPLKVASGVINFKNISFTYTDAGGSGKVFQGLQLKIAAGEKIGLVGPSGGGKSTLTRLILRFEDVQSGIISIDTQNIAEVTQTSLRQAIAYVPQEPLLFHRTIAQNIAYGSTQADAKSIKVAAKKAHALDFIEALPQGFETIVGERGVKLSGGQRQRIAIARAILKDAPILVLDEATSALDSESEAAIQSALTELMEGRTTLVIAHRLSTIQRLDRIVVLEKGAVVEQGTHAKLLEQKGLYARLWTHQSGGFIEEQPAASPN